MTLETKLQGDRQLILTRTFAAPPDRVFRAHTEADLVIMALGFEPEDLPTLWDCPELTVTNWGTIKANFKSHATEMPSVYAAGDIVRGASLVVWAIRDGREAADAILDQLNTSKILAAE